MTLFAAGAACISAATLASSLAQAGTGFHASPWGNRYPLSHTPHPLPPVPQTGPAFARRVPLSQPDDMAVSGGHVYVAFQNGVGSKGEAAAAAGTNAGGNLDSTLVKFTLAGKPVAQWDLQGKIDGLGAGNGTVYATVNEDGNSSLYALSGATITHYRYSPSPLGHGGGTDSVVVVHGLILISASAPAKATGAAVYSAKLNPATKVAKLKTVFRDNAKVKMIAGKAVSPLTDPDSSELVTTGKYAGDFLLNSQGDQELLYVSHPGTAKQKILALKISQSIDDSAFPTKAGGEILTTNGSGIAKITGPFKRGTQYAAVTPCNANSASASCSTPNWLGAIDQQTGKVARVGTTGVALTPKGMVYVP